MRLSGDPLADFSRHDAECERGLSKLPDAVSAVNLFRTMFITTFTTNISAILV